MLASPIFWSVIPARSIETWPPVASESRRVILIDPTGAVNGGRRVFAVAGVQMFGFSETEIEIEPPRLASLRLTDCPTFPAKFVHVVVVSLFASQTRLTVTKYMGLAWHAVGVGLVVGQCPPVVMSAFEMQLFMAVTVSEVLRIPEVFSRKSVAYEVCSAGRPVIPVSVGALFAGFRQATAGAAVGAVAAPPVAGDPGAVVEPPRAACEESKPAFAPDATVKPPPLMPQFWKARAVSKSVAATNTIAI